MMNRRLVQNFRDKLDEIPVSDHYGLNSPGLTCYLNSVLQVLFMTDDFREAVKSCRGAVAIDRLLGALFAGLERSASQTHRIAAELGITDVFKQRDAAEYLERILNATSPDASKIFQGELTHRTTCCGCRQKNDSRNFFWVLPLGVDSADGTFNVQRGLDDFFREQRVGADNQMFCHSCGQKQDADTQCQLTQSPDVLTLLLKRFAFDFQQRRYRKLQSRAHVGRTLRVQGCSYDLYAVIHHFGDLTGGHYTSEIRSFETGQWYSFNDRTVKSVIRQRFEVGDDCLRSSTAYLLMYRKVTQGPRKAAPGHSGASSADWERNAAERWGTDFSFDHLLKAEMSRGRNENQLKDDRRYGHGFPRNQTRLSGDFYSGWTPPTPTKREEWSGNDSRPSESRPTESRVRASQRPEAPGRVGRPPASAKRRSNSCSRSSFPDSNPKPGSSSDLRSAHRGKSADRLQKKHQDKAGRPPWRS